jgi:hypothetical protein
MPHIRPKKLFSNDIANLRQNSIIKKKLRIQGISAEETSIHFGEACVRPVIPISSRMRK